MPKIMIWAWIKNRAIIEHQGPLLASDPGWNGSKYNVQVKWETGEIAFVLNPSPSLLLMIQSLVQYMPKEMIYLL